VSLTWRQVADLLAARMHNHAFCLDHPASAPEQGCPHCADRSAYEAWSRKAGRTHDEPSYEGPVVTIDPVTHELRER
jgi:hypothetical protein